MTFALTRDNGEFEWAGDTIFTLFCQPKNLFKWSMWRMIWDILRFNASARRLIVEAESDGERNHSSSSPLSLNSLRNDGSYKQEKVKFTGNGVHEEIEAPKCKEMSIGEYLEKNGYSDAFKDDYLIVSCPFGFRSINN
jgi:predicted NAD/FAD-binding protein